VRERLDEINEISDADLVVITFTRARNLPGYRRRFAAPLRVATDENLELYHALGFRRGSIRRVWGLRATRRYVQLLRGGARLERSDEDTLQLGGNAVFDGEGRLVWRYAGAGPDDRPDVDEIIEALRSI
jgi:hypothetical protein